MELPGQRARLEPAAAFPGTLPCFDIPGQAALGVLEPRGEHGAPLGQAGHLDLEVPAQHRHMRPTVLEPTTGLVRGRQPARSRRGHGLQFGQTLAEQGELHAVALDALGQPGPVPGSLRPFLLDERELGPDPAVRGLEPLGLVVGPVHVSSGVSRLDRRPRRVRPRPLHETRRPLGRCRGALGLCRGLACQGRQCVGPRTDHPSARREAVALGAHDRHVGSFEGYLHRPRPVALHTGDAEEEAIENNGDGGHPGTYVPAEKLCAGGQGRAGSYRRGPVTHRPFTHRRGGEHGPHYLTFVQGGQHGARRIDPLYHHGSQSRPDRGLEGGHPSIIDVNQVHQRPQHG